jgi:putative ABC transport system permease protein
VNVRESARFAVRGVTANKMRSALTTLGILIGVAAVIILVAVGTGSSQAVQNSLSRLGSNVLNVRASQGGTGGRGGGGFAAAFGGGGGGGGARAAGGSETGSSSARTGSGTTGTGATGSGSATAGAGAGAAGSGAVGSVSSGTQSRISALTLADAESLTDKTLAPDVLSVAPVVSASSVTATYAGASHAVATFTGTSPSYLLNDDDSVQAGSPFTDSDYLNRHRVALLGTTVAQDLIGGTGLNIVGKTVQFNGIDYQVVGVLTAKGSSGPQDQDDRVIAPLTAVQDTLSGYGNVSSISVKATSATTVSAAQSEVEDVLNGRHHVTTATEDYSIFSSASILSAATSTTQTFTVLLGAVAAISLLVGGIGVMNIMLVTVTERTREIGIRKAIGAQRADIVGQFLLEAVLLSLFGGVMGVVAGLVGSRFTVVGVQPVVAPYSVFLAFGVAVAVGLFFGLYPANRAAALRPIDALRYE